MFRFRNVFRTLATVREAPQISSEQLSKTKLTPSSRKFAERIVSKAKESIKNNEPHFRVGGNKVFFPKARVILLRPNAKHTPYQAKFIVPKSFNKLDLRDYLWHVYGLRALNVTTQLLPGKYIYNGRQGRYRSAQIKKMTIDMEDPFIWPSEEPKELERAEFENEIMKYRYDFQSRQGSDLLKPIKQFEGVLKFNKEHVKYNVEAFVPRNVGRRMRNVKRKAENKYKESPLVEKVLKNL